MFAMASLTALESPDRFVFVVLIFVIVVLRFAATALESPVLSVDVVYPAKVVVSELAVV